MRGFSISLKRSGLDEVMGRKSSDMVREEFGVKDLCKE